MTLAASFARGSGRKAKHRGRTIHSFVRLDVNDGTRLTITRLGSSSVRAQSLKLAVDRGDLRANGVMVPMIAVWSHSAPEVATVEIVGRRARSVDLWNSWSHEGVDSAWLGNAAIRLESDGSSHVLRCSDGLGEPTFDDLVVRVDVSDG